MSTPKGFPTQQKKIDGQPSLNEFVTVQPTDGGLRNVLDVTRSAFRVGDQTNPLVAGAGTGNDPDNTLGTYVDDAGTLARLGDFVRFSTGNAAYLEIAIAVIDTNGFRLAARLPSYLEPTAGDEFFIMRPVTSRVDETGTISVSSGPIQFNQDGTPVTVDEDSNDPTQTRPLPVSQAGRVVNEFGQLDYASTPVDDTTPVEVIASVATAATAFTLFESGGYPLILCIGAAGLENDYMLIPPGGFNGDIPCAFAVGTRLSVKALRAGVTVSVGDFLLNLMR